MKKIKLLAGITIVSLFASCNHVYKEYDKKSFPTYTWSSGQEVVFSPTIEDITKAYKLILGIRHLYGFPVDKINVTIKTISPSGKVSAIDYDFVIKDADNKNIGKCGGDLCDLETVVNDNFRFEESGIYKFVITHNIENARIPGVMELGLIIDEKE